MDLFSAIVPCKSEEESIPLFYEQFVNVMKSMGRDNYEIIFVEDGSLDNTLDILRSLAKKDSHVKYISFSRNFGKEAAMYAGLLKAKGEFVAIMDADMQDPPELLAEMFDIIKDDNVDCVAARRKTRVGEPPIRSFMARLFYKALNSMSPLKFKEGARDFRLLRRRVVDSILQMNEYNRFIKGMYEWVGFNTKWIEFDNVERIAGKTKWSFFGLMLYSLDAITSFSTVPLVAATVLGILFCFLSSIAIVFLSIRQLIFHNSAFGWTSMVCILFFLSGLQLFCLGVIGQYMSKIYLETKNRPKFIISEQSL